ncbi:endonuclease domain-containing protein [bacterium]|nr:endonuclease domain-containing protein [bacterium]
MFFRKVDKEKRRTLRLNMTNAEKYLWQELRKKKRNGYRFRRQFSVGGFILDFYCISVMLAVEVDGKYHDFTKEYDEERENIIKNLGITFLRFSNKEVIKDWQTVNLKIEKQLHELRSRRDGGAVSPKG